MKKIFAVTAAIVLLSMGLAAQAVMIDTVPVGDAGNAGELSGAGGRATGDGPARICGSVGYNYNIGKYEVTAGQYTAFLNAVAATDTHGLYNTEMSSNLYRCGINRTGASGSYTYTVSSYYADRPVSSVSYWDACRFANWLGNGQKTGAQDTSTTEDGAYTLTADGITNNTITRNAGATWAVTSEDEWYKAAYYKGGGTNAGYWEYPTNSSPVNFNLFNMGHFVDYPINVGSYACTTAYGTHDQGGNVWEWNEALIGGLYRGMRGGAWDSPAPALWASYRVGGMYPTSEGCWVGFRVSEVAPVPEPSSLIALAGGLMSLLGMRRRRA